MRLLAAGIAGSLQNRLGPDPIFGIFLFLILIAGMLSHPVKRTAPEGYMDVPANGATVKNVLNSTGWAIADGGVASVGIYVDGRYIEDAAIRLPRPDVLKASPGNTDGENTGWTANVNLSDFKPGLHVITAEFEGQYRTEDQDSSFGTPRIRRAFRPEMKGAPGETQISLQPGTRFADIFPMNLMLPSLLREFRKRLFV